MTSGRVLHGLPAPVRTVAPASEPVTLAEAKLQCRVDHTDDDDLINGLIEAATAHLDGYAGILGRGLITQTWRQDFPCFGSVMRLPLRPVASITSITYYDADNASQTLGSDTHGLFVDALGPYVALKPDQDWPSVYSRRDAVSVTFVCGEAVPPTPIKRAILILIGHWHANREAVAPGDMREVPMAVDSLLRPYRMVGV